MPGVTTQHPEYERMSPLWDKVRLFLQGEEAVKQAGETFLPKTTGMKKDPVHGQAQYDAYKNRARVLELPSQAQNALLGIAYEKPPTGTPDVPFTLQGKSDVEFSAKVLREVSANGRYIAVVDSYDGELRVVGYNAASLINWRTNAAGELIFAVFVEDVSSATDKYSHDTEKQYRVYEQGTGSYTITLLDEEEHLIGDVVTVPRDSLDIVIFGSVDNTAGVDTAPLLPVVNATLSAYQLSADYKHALFMAAQPTPCVKGINETQWEAMLDSGIGSSSLWWLGDEGEATFLETTGQGIDALKAAIADEVKHAEANAVRLTQTASGNTEGVGSMLLRSHAQQATLYTIINAVEHGINALWEIIVERSSSALPEPFKFSIDMNPLQASAQMLTALSNAVGQQAVPQGVLFAALRKFKLTTKTDEELADELSTSGAGLPQ